MRCEMPASASALAHAAAGGREVDAVGKVDFGGDRLRLGSGGGEVRVQLRVGIEARDR